VPDEEELKEQLEAIDDMLGYEDGQFGYSHESMRRDRKMIRQRLRGWNAARAAGVD